MSEENKECRLTKCKKCGQIKRRIFDGLFPSGDKRWVDEDGKQWMGKTCGCCNQKRAKDVMKEVRRKKKERQENG